MRRLFIDCTTCATAWCLLVHAHGFLVLHSVHQLEVCDTGGAAFNSTQSVVGQSS